MKWSDVEVWADNTIGGDREPLAAESFARALLALKPVVEELEAFDAANDYSKLYPYSISLDQLNVVLGRLAAYRKSQWRIEP